uniref:AlNc14C12G1487 protein n=1 Tax=Albugo laibachii Nc14 TaxID=890382 RepID=F0W3B0_9STRA|nr:AlNc14C12G1487 [Albugo laibachii Nc14]|eukprot:CCA15553.1 AlNc14C12G1487 [Albugo laibachii Nc14]
MSLNSEWPYTRTLTFKHNEIYRRARKAERYMDVYQIVLPGRAAEYAVRKPRSHRRIPRSFLMNINTLTSGTDFLQNTVTKNSVRIYEV